MPPIQVNLHAFEPRSRANGPGLRAVLWFQGCTLGCPGCFNPATHDSEKAPDPFSPFSLVSRIQAEGDAIEGISISGGEPFQQAAALYALLEALRARTDLSVLVFSGYTIAEIRAQELGPSILGLVDVLVDGRYRAREHLAEDVRGSANQQIHLLTDRYCLKEVEATPAAEIVIDPSGAVLLTGVNPPKL